MKEGSCNPSLLINTEPPGLDCQIHRRGRSHLFTQKGTLFTMLMSLPGLRGNGPALAGKLWKGWSFRAVREGGTAGVGNCRGRSHLFTQKGATLYYTNVIAEAPRDRSCARREARERMERSRCARGEGLIASNARSGPVPLLLPLREVSGAGLWKKGVG